MPQDDATQAGGQAAQPILPGASSLVRTGGGAAVNEAGMSTAVVPSANPAAQPVVLGGSGALPTTATTPTAGTNALPTSTQPATDPFSTPAWLQPVPTTPASQIVPPVQSQPMPVTQAVSSPALVTTPAATIPDLPVSVVPMNIVQGTPASNVPAVSSSAVGNAGVPTTSVSAAIPTMNASATDPAPFVPPPPADTNSNPTTDPLTGGPIDWDSIAKRFEEQSTAVPTALAPEAVVPLATVTSTTDLAASDVTEPLPTTVEAPETSASTTDSAQAPVVVPDGLGSPITTTFDPSFGLPEVSAQSELSEPQTGGAVENQKKGGGLKSLLSGLGAVLSSLPWNKKRKEKGESEQQQISSDPAVNANITPDMAVLPPLSAPGTDTVPDLGTTPVTPAELAAATALPEKPLVPLAGPETSTLPELSGLDAVPKDLFDPNNFVMPSSLPGLPAQTIGGGAMSGSDQPAKKGPNLVKVFIVLVIVVLLGTGVLFLITQISSSPGGTSNSPVNPLPTTPGDSGNETPGVEVPQEPGNKVDTKSIYIYLVSFGADSAANIPDGSVQIGSDYLVRVLTAENVQAEEPVSIALAKLLSLNTEKYADTKYSNLLYKSKLKALVKEGENGKLSIDLQGTFEVAKDGDYSYAKQQVERTIENYTFNYTLSLNGSEESWISLGEGN